ncbi:s-adenosyl-l-methionine-dependent methyltransferase [Lucifera butyrica]|uniref:S-adenosyl-l-methionine-dependent methyltransferase n=1 Tax=Lucifera butyrica TaxID=1351585 RepID=A0A498R4I0_9FIRM|nr:cyclopropane-fatty-acyl-phospholipid synthase family protein [Lucifera butyrica]VBB05083.1 s-adenosyl-l-methionine-dependent methyltransferase [Lucifera butyrica]
MKKALLQTVFGQVKRGGIAVRYWDGEETRYGDAPPQAKIIFLKEPSILTGLEDPTLTFAEFYMDGIIDYEGSLDEIIRLVEWNWSKRQQTDELGKKVWNSALRAVNSVADKLTDKKNIQQHYDLGNDFFSLWLDKTMSYSCAYFKQATDSLFNAQLQKIDLALKKLRLKPGERLLDIGSGWGWLILRAAQQYGVKALGITLSQEQYDKTRERIAEAGLTGQVDVKLISYMDINEAEYQFDKIVSIGMFEHVGQKNLPVYMKKVHDLLVQGGTSLLHSITNVIEHEPNTWMRKYIFPGGYVPTLREIVNLLPDYDFHLLQAESLRLHYAMTLEHWYRNFSRYKEEVEQKFGRRFVRMWSLYLQGCAASFRVSGLDIHQLVFTKGLNNTLPLTWQDVYSEE